MVYDFEALARAASADHTKAAEHELWKAAVMLEYWYFVAASARDDAEPVVGSIGGKPFVLAFTGEGLATEFAKRRAAHRGEDDAPVVHMEPAEAVSYFETLREAGVEGAVFNTGGAAFQASMADIIDRHTRYTRGR